MILAERAARTAAEIELVDARAEASGAKADLTSTEALIAHLKLAIEKLRRALYGSRSERQAKRMDVGEDLRAVAFLLSDGRQSRDGGELDLQAGDLVGVAANGHKMGTRPGGRIELSVDAMIRILAWPGGRRFGQPVGLHAHEEGRADPHRRRASRGAV